MFRAIALLIDKSPSTVSRGVRASRLVRAVRIRKGTCYDRSRRKRELSASVRFLLGV